MARKKQPPHSAKKKGKIGASRKKPKTPSSKPEASPKKAVDSSKQSTVSGKRQAPRKKAPLSPDNTSILKSVAGFPIVGIGASAGGLQAFEEFFRNMPAGSGIAFVLVTHLDPTHFSNLPDLVQEATEMTVCQIADGMQVKPNCVYVIPPNKHLTIRNGALQLEEPFQPRSANLPIDIFLRSLAQDQGSKAIGIILSGTGKDGTLGIKSIKGELGMVMVQDEESAKFSGMPRSVIATGLADYVLSPQEMPEQLIKYAKHATHQTASRLSHSEMVTPDTLQKVFEILRARTGHDFSLYKKNTIFRRIERRMNVHQISDISQYVRYIRESKWETDILFKELLIGVTSFFRDPEAFESLKQKVLLNLLKAKPDELNVRVWVPGCSSGEEAYSIAIVLLECMAELQRRCSVQIFGTDIDEDAIDWARSGLYPTGIEADVSPERLKRYFIKEDDGQYRIEKKVREMLVFAHQSIIKDPPFTQLQLISCRNLLIYLGDELQKRLLPLFHYSLSEGGYLVLGSSESIGHTNDLFTPLDKKWKIFRSKPSVAASHAMLRIPAVLASHEYSEAKVVKKIRNVEEMIDLELAETILQESGAPPCVIIDEACNIVYVHGRTGKFLEPAAGKASFNIIEMARDGLRTVLTSCIRNVSQHNQEVTQKDVHVQNDGGRTSVNLTVKPIENHDSIRGLKMVVFQENESAATKTKGSQKPLPVKNTKKTAEELEMELQFTKEDLQTTIEEFKSANEELQSTNEELQSTNEEMETSKEELQSLNEESAIVNAELQSRIEELSNANDDMKNLLDSIDFATVFLDIDLCVRRFTPMILDIIPLGEQDCGRPIKHFATTLINVDLNSLSEEVLKDLKTIEREIESNNGHFYAMRIQPYRTVNNVIDGVVITLGEITVRKRAEEQTFRLLATVLRDSNDAVIIYDAEGRILAWNHGAKRMYGYSETEALQMSVFEMIPREKRDKAVKLTSELMNSGKAASFETQRTAKDGRILDVWQTATVLIGACGEPNGVLTTERDITSHKKMEQAMAEQEKTILHLKERLKSRSS